MDFAAQAIKLLKWKRILVAILERKIKTLTVILEMLRNVSRKKGGRGRGSRFGGEKVKVHINNFNIRSF